jgi:hypothetical protein
MQHAAANRASIALWRRCFEMGISNAHTLGHLYGSLIQPILNYGCEIWSPDILSNINISNGITGFSETIQTKFLKRALGVKECTTNKLVLHELNRSPTWTQWLKQCIGFWNKIVDRKDNDFVKKTLIENVLLTINDGNKHCWSHGLLNCIKKLGVISHFSNVLQNGKLMKIDVGTVDDKIAQITDIDWSAMKASNPRSVDNICNIGSKTLTYNTWMKSVDCDESPGYTRILNNKNDISCIARFRLRSHTLRVEEDIHLPRSERTCKCCNIFIDGERAVEDEMHFMLECPLFSQERKTLFEKLRIEYDPNEKASCMRNIMNPESSKGWNYLLKYINKCDEKRKVELSVIRQM